MEQELQSQLEEFELQQQLEELEKSQNVPQTQTSGELDLDGLQQRRDSGETDEAILNDLVNQAGTNFNMDGKPFDLAPLLTTNTPASLLDFITAGKMVSSDVSSKPEAALAGTATGLTNIIGLPGDLVGMAQNAVMTPVEAGVRRASNFVSGLTAPEGVDDPSSPNYDPDFYLSTDTKDFVTTTDKPLLGGAMVRDAGNAFNKAIGIDSEYIEESSELSPELRPYFTFSRVFTESVATAAAVLKAAKVGFGLSNPIMKEAADNPAKFRNAELAAGGGASGLASFTEAVGLGDNVWAMMGAEFVGSLLGGGTAAATNKAPDVLSGAGKSLDTLIAAFSPEAANRGAINDILIAAKDQRNALLEKAKAAEASGDSALYDRLIEDAEAHTPERIIQDLETSLALGDASPASGINLPAGSLTDNPALLSIQNALTKNSDFKSDVSKELNIALSQILKTSEQLAGAGNLAAADTLRSRYFQQLLNSRISAAQNEATSRVSALSPGVSPEVASTTAQSVLFDAKMGINDMETYLWDRIDPNLTTSGTELTKRIRLLQKNRILEGETLAGGGQLDAVISAIYKQAAGDGPMSAKNVRTFRSRMLTEARTARDNNQYHQAGIFDELASAAVDELNTIPMELGGADILAARNFSKLKNDRFSRYFAKDVAQTSDGATKLRPTQVLETAVTGTGTNRSENMSELRAAASEADNVAPKLTRLKDLDAQRKAARDADFNATQNVTQIEGTVAADSANLATTDNVIYPENTSYPRSQVRGEDFVTDDGTVIFPPDGRRTPPQTFSDDLVDEAGNPIPRDELPDGMSDAEKLDQMFNRPKGATNRTNTTDAPEEEFKLNEGGQSAEVPAIRDEGVVQNLGSQMTQAQEDFLRGSVVKLRNTDGTISTEKLEAFMSAQQNSEVLKAFPEFRAELTGLVDAQRTADEIAQRFSAIAETGKLPDAIGTVLKSNSPVDDYTKLAQEALGDQDALADLRMATVDKLFESATAGENTDFIKLTEELTRPLSGRSGDVSILEVMQQNGVINVEETDALVELMAEGLRIQRSSMDIREFQDVVTQTSDIISNGSRILGANFGSMFGMGDGSQLQAAAIGSAAFKKITSGLPVGNKLNQMRIMMLNPRLLVAALKQNPTIRKGAIDAFKEYAIKYGQSFKGLSKPMAVGKLALDATLFPVPIARGAAVSAFDNAPITSSGAFSEGRPRDESRPVVTVDQQMEEALPQ